MKLRPGEPGRMGLKAQELIIPEQPSSPDFDLQRDVPPEVWKGDVEQIEAFYKEEHIDITGLIPTARLAVLRPELKKLFVQDPEIKVRVEKWLNASWSLVLGEPEMPNEFRLAEAVTLLQVFPELRTSIPKPSDHQIRSILRNAEEGHYVGSNEFIFRTGDSFLTNILQAFPEWYGEIQVLLQKPDFKQKFELRLYSLLRSDDEFDKKVIFLANSTLLYPNEAERYKQLAYPFWPEVKRILRDSRSFGKADIAIAAAILSASEAKINSHGELKLTRSAPQHSQQKLPERLIA